MRAQLVRALSAITGAGLLSLLGAVGGGSMATPGVMAAALRPTAAATVRAGQVTFYPGIFRPRSITAGPDGALWFTNLRSIGRMTTSGKVTNFSDPSIDSPEGITTGPDGAL